MATRVADEEGWRDAISRGFARSWAVAGGVALAACAFLIGLALLSYHPSDAALNTAAGGVPSVRLAYSNDAGAGFSKTLIFKRGDALQGRVDLSADTKGAWLLWTEERDRQTLWLQRLDGALQADRPPVRVATLAGRGRATGFARMQQVDGALYVVWTDVVAGKPALRGARIPAAH